MYVYWYIKLDICEGGTVGFEQDYEKKEGC